jgi:hypothetical protein
MIGFWLLLACGGGETERPESAPALITEANDKTPGDLAGQLGLDRLRRAELAPILGPELDYPTYTVRPLSLQVFPDFRISGALYSPKTEGPYPAFLMAHGHFGEGKSSGEAQAPAHALAHRGYVVLALDTPGVEEGDLPRRQIHFEEGRANRERLERAGSSALAIQIHGLQAGLDYLEHRVDSGWMATGGASGGAVQAFYLAQIDARPKALVMASFVPLPRQEKMGGCACDWVPGGWTQDWIAGLKIPSLWMSEGAQARPATLGPSHRFVTHAGPHGFERPMIDEAVAWLEGFHTLASGSGLPAQIPHTPASALASATVGTASIADLLAAPAPPRAQ